MKLALTNDRLPIWLQRIVAISLGLIFILMPFHAFLSTWGGTAIGPLEAWKSWKEVVLALIALLVLAWLLVRPRRLRDLLQDKLAWLVLGYAGIMALLAVINLPSNGHDATLAGLAMNGRYLLAFALSYILLRYGSFEWIKIRKSAAMYIVAIGAFIAALGILQVTLVPLDFLSQFGYDKTDTIAPNVLIDNNPDAPRAFATLRGPNDFGAFLILPIVLCLLFVRRQPRLLALAGLLSIGLYVSGSRSAWLGALVTIAIVVWGMFGRRLMKPRSLIIGGLAGVLVGGLLLLSALNIPSVRLALFHSSPSDPSLTEGSTDAHWAATADGLHRVLDNPLGCGAGCAGPASYYGNAPKISENYYVQIAEETGIIGLLAWLGIVVMVAVRLWRQRSDWLAMALFATLAGLSVIGLWLHVWSDDPLSLTWWLLAGAILGQSSHILYSKQKQHDRQTQKNTR